MGRPGPHLKRSPASAGVRFPLAALLADGRWHGGPALGAALGVGRAMVWKQVGALRAAGAPVEGRRGRGYRIAGGLDLLSADEVRSRLSPEAAALLGELLVVDSVDSTNRLAAERIRVPSGPACCVCLAEHQDAGRGRMGRRWVSPFAANVYLSAALRCDRGVAALEGLGLAVGVAVAECLLEFGAPVKLKWPNDIVSDAGKLAGVLLEVAGEWEGRCELVAGVGLNVRMTESMAGDIDQPWAALAQLAPAPVARNALAAALANALLPLLHGYAERGLEGYRERWLTLDALRGRRVAVRAGGHRLIGTARGIDASGALLLDTADGRRAVHGGEASVRPVE